MVAILLRYFRANVLSRAISLIMRVCKPISINTANSALKDSANDRTPKPSAARWRATYTVNSNPRIKLAMLERNRAAVFLAILWTALIYLLANLDIAADGVSEAFIEGDNGLPAQVAA